MKLLTQEQHDYLASIIKGRTSNKCTEMLNKKFNLNLRVSQIRTYKKNHNLVSGVVTRFSKGHIPANKGKKLNLSGDILVKIKKGWFKKGQIPLNHKPVGSERVTVDGYIEVKVMEPNVWEFKHRVVWEAHYGEIPKDKMISFVNGNGTDCSIDNLIMIDKQINGMLNTRFKTKERPKELVDVVGDIVQIRNKIKELKNGKNI